MGVLDRFDLEGRVAVVTGGSRGLGREMVLAYAECGADVVIASRKLDNCEALAAEVRDRFGRAALAHACHVGEWKQIDEMIDAAYERFGRIDVLVNNAGMSPLYDAIDEVSEALYDKVLSVNLKGPFRAMAYGGMRMKRAGSGSIINVSSRAGDRPTPGEVSYGAAKAGLNNLTLGFARTLGPEVRVNCIAAGPFYTDVSKAWDLEAVKQALARTQALGRGGEADEVVGAALFFASDASAFCTGAVLNLDGGLL